MTKVKVRAKQTVKVKARNGRKKLEHEKQRTGRNTSAVRDRKQYLCRCLHGGMPEHLPLPRAIGAYRTVHLTKIVPSSARYFLAGFMSTTSGGKDRMSNIIAMESVNAAGGVNAANNTRRFVHSTGLANMNCAPAAMTVKVMANEPLQTATGTVRLGQANQS